MVHGCKSHQNCQLFSSLLVNKTCGFYIWFYILLWLDWHSIENLHILLYSSPQVVLLSLDWSVKRCILQYYWNMILSMNMLERWYDFEGRQKQSPLLLPSFLWIPFWKHRHRIISGLHLKWHLLQLSCMEYLLFELHLLPLFCLEYLCIVLKIVELGTQLKIQLYLNSWLNFVGWSAYHTVVAI